MITIIIFTDRTFCYVHNVITTLDKVMISSPGTDGTLGNWPYMQYCPAGWFVKAIQIKYQVNKGENERIDDTALNMVGMRCYRRNVSPYVRTIFGLDKSLYRKLSSDHYGDWGSVYSCSGKDNPVVGFRMQIETTGCKDCVGANNIHLRCKNGQILRPRVQNDWGSWSDWVLCPSGKAVIALQTRTAWPLYGPRYHDNITLNGVRLICNKYDF